MVSFRTDPYLSCVAATEHRGLCAGDVYSPNSMYSVASTGQLLVFGLNLDYTGPEFVLKQIQSECSAQL